MPHTPDPVHVLRQKSIILGIYAIITSTLILAPDARSAQDSPAETSRPVCLDVNRIDHTEVLNDHQILFHMVDRKTWINNLTSRCTTLTRQDGWAWVSRIPKYCDNVELIRVLRSGQVCTLGAFTPYEKPPKAG